MASVTLFCEESPELKLGPGTLLNDPENVIWFRDGFAKIDRDDPMFAEKMRWVTAGGTPLIEVLPDDEPERVVADAHAQNVCVKCGKAFKNRGGMLGHMRSHAPD